MPKRIKHLFNRVMKSRKRVTKANVKKEIKNEEEFRVTTLSLRRGVEQLFPERMRLKMRNLFAINFTGVAGIPNHFSALGNGLFNPLTNGFVSGAFPPSVGAATSIMGLPLLLSADSSLASTGAYNNYRVHSSRLRVEISNTSLVANEGVIVVVYPMAYNAWSNHPNVSSLTAVTASEFPYSKYRNIGAFTFNKSPVITNNSSTSKMYALKYKSTLEDPQYGGIKGANPANAGLWYWNVFWYPVNASNTAGTCLCTLTYDIELYNRNSLGSGQG